MGILWNINPTIEVKEGMLMNLQHAMRQARGRKVCLCTAVNGKLSAFFQIFRYLPDRPTHLQDLEALPPTWVGAIDAFVTCMVGVCRDL